jgi:hypothetical protein
MSEVKVIHSSNPIARDLVVIRDRYPGGRLPTRYRGNRIASIAVEEAYIYPRVTPGLTRDEVIQTITGLMNRTGIFHPSTFTLRDSTVICGIPYGLEMSGTMGQSQVLQIKILNDSDGSPRVIPVDEVSNIQ